MADKKIIYLKQSQLHNPLLKSTLAQFPQHDWAALLKYSKYNCGVDSIYSRYGKNTFPLTASIDSLGWTAPQYDSMFNKTWSDVTNQRCLDLWKMYSNQPWLIYWSGGIDSTVILTSILQNLQPQDFSNIHVACNFSSICENPEFFYKHIEPNFKLIDSTNLILDQELLNTYLLIDGEPADQLFAGGAAHDLIFQDSSLLFRDVRTSPDQLIAYLTQKVDAHFATWFYERQIENIDSIDVPIHTYHDFFWWSYFNLLWISVKFRNLQYEQCYNQKGLQLYLTKFIHWFDTGDYQLWSMCNNQFGIKYGANMTDYKLVAKQYIHLFDHNDYYLKYKLKTNSTSRDVYHKEWFCILDDLSRLNLNDDLEQILDLLPNHIA